MTACPVDWWISFPRRGVFDPEESVFDSVSVSSFPIEPEDLTGVGVKLSTLSDRLAGDETEEFLKSCAGSLDTATLLA